MKRVVVVQARMTSTRLPGKVLMDLAGRPLLAQQLTRLKRCRTIDEIVVATTDRPTDDPVVALAEQEGVGWFRGDETDVLGRYVGAARQSGADVVVRATSDCPLIDPIVVDRIVARLLGGGEPCDYASNTLVRTYPRGLDAEALYTDTLLRINRLATSRPAREHVTYFLHRERPELFLTAPVTDATDNSDLRWTVDTQADLDLVRRVYEGLRLAEGYVPYPEVLGFVRARPEITELNRDVTQKEV